MAGVHKCRWKPCDKYFPTPDETRDIDWVELKTGQYYHMECYKKLINPQEHPKKEDPETTRRKIYGILSCDLKVAYNWHQVEAQINNFLKSTSPKMTLKGIYFTLYYHYIIKNNPWKPEYGIGIVPVVYEIATSYWVEEEKKKTGIMQQIMEISEKKQSEARVIKPAERKKKHHIESPF